MYQKLRDGRDFMHKKPHAFLASKIIEFTNDSFNYFSLRQFHISPKQNVLFLAVYEATSLYAFNLGTSVLNTSD